MRYFFHLHNDIDARDEEGREFPDIDVARAHAVAEAREMASESVSQGHLNLDHFIEVGDDSGRTLFRTTFGEAVHVTGGHN